MTHRDPIDIEIWRGAIVESQHTVLAAIVDSEGRLVAAFGDVDRLVYARSAIKPLQALPLLETGAADAYGLGDAEIALACASHNGTPAHVTIAESWLAKLDLVPEALACGAHLPYGDGAAREILAHGKSPSPLHNNCSGKHLGMLSTALHCGEDPTGYEAIDHPVQQRIRAALSGALGRNLDAAPVAIDGCSVPTVGMALREVAAMLARFGAAAAPNAGRVSTAGRIAGAMVALPEIIAGEGRFCTDITRVGKGEVLVKGGAEGIGAALLREPGLAIVVKAIDGAKRAAEAALAALIPRFAPLSTNVAAVLARHAAPAIENWRGIRTGYVRAVFPDQQGGKKGQRQRRGSTAWSKQSSAADMAGSIP